MQPFDVTPSAPQNMASNGPITVTDATHRDLGLAMAAVTATGGIMARFFYTRVRLKTHNAEKNGQWETRLCVAKQPKADRSTVATQFISADDAKRYFPREYEHFTKNEEMPSNGTPLSELPGITMSQLGILTISGLRSIEDLADITADQAREIGFDAIRAHKLAQQWLARAEGEKETINLADLEARYQQELAANRQTAEALRKRLEEQEIQIAALRSMHGGSGSGQPAQAQSQKAVVMDHDDGLPDSFEGMPNPMAEGPDVVELSDPLLE